MKVFEGIIISVGMNKTVVVEVSRRTPHPLYRKLIKRSKKLKADNAGFEELEVGNRVKIIETRPISKKPPEVRMGGGKGDVSEFVAPVKRGRMLFEMAGVSPDVAHAALRLASHKLGIKTKIVDKKE